MGQQECKHGLLRQTLHFNPHKKHGNLLRGPGAGALWVLALSGPARQAIAAAAGRGQDREGPEDSTAPPTAQQLANHAAHSPHVHSLLVHLQTMNSKSQMRFCFFVSSSARFFLTKTDPKNQTYPRKQAHKQKYCDARWCCRLVCICLLRQARSRNAYWKRSPRKENKMDNGPTSAPRMSSAAHGHAHMYVSGSHCAAGVSVSVLTPDCFSACSGQR